MPARAPDEATLHAWVDDELAPDAATAVAQWLAEHPEAAARTAAFQAQRAGLQALHAQVLDEPVPPRLRRALRPPPVACQWPGARPAPRAGTVAALPAFVREAAAAHAVYVPEQRHPVEVAAQQQAHLVQWLSRRLGTALKVPVLDEQGFHLVGGRLLPGEAGQARAQFMYQDAAGLRLTLYVSVLAHPGTQPAAPAAFQWTADGATQGFYWIDGHQGYALSAALPRERLHALAEAVYRQLE